MTQAPLELGTPQGVGLVGALKQLPIEQKKGAGRPTVMTKDVLRKLEDAFMNAFTDEMACLYAGIGKTALYEYCKENPQFAERKETLKETPHLAAQKELVEGIKGNLSQARWWAEHRMPDFMPKSKVEHSGTIEGMEGAGTETLRALADEFEEKMKAALIAGIQAKP